MSLPLEPPKWLKAIYDWVKIYGIVAALIGGVSGLWLGKVRGPTVGIFGASVILMIYLAIRLGQERTAARAEVRRILDTSTQGTPEERLAALRQLGLSHWLASAALGLLFVSLAGGAIWWKWPPAPKPQSQPPIAPLHLPDRVVFSGIHELRAGNDDKLMKEAPFLEALKSHFLHESAKSRIVLGGTDPFVHPSPPFGATFSSDGRDWKLAVYAFRCRAAEKGFTYDPIIVTYPIEGSVTLQIPSMEVGDTLFLFGRVTLMSGNEFPQSSDLGQLVVFTRN